MSKKIAVITCVNSGIDYIKNDYDIRVLRSILLVGENEYEDYVDISADDFYKMLQVNPELTPRTAQPSTGKMLQTYENLAEEGYDEAIFITISSKLSGIYEGAILANNMIDNFNVTVFDSKSLSYPQSKMVLEACKMAEEGRSIEEIIKRLEFIRDNNHIYFAVHTLKYLVKNGRLSSASGIIGGMLKIKPLLEITKNGEVVSIEKIRTTKKAIDRLIEKFLEEIKDLDVEVFISHANNYEAVDFIRNEILTKRPNIKEVKDYPLTPVVGAHAGPKAVGLGYALK